MLRDWKEMGIKLDPDSGVGDDYAEFYTPNREVAIKAGFVCEYEDGRKFLETRSGKKYLPVNDLS